MRCQRTNPSISVIDLEKLHLLNSRQVELRNGTEHNFVDGLLQLQAMLLGGCLLRLEGAVVECFELFFHLLEQFLAIW